MDVIAGDGVRLWWTVEGTGPRVVLVPGRGNATDIYPERFTAPILDAGFQVIRYDPRDTGLSGDGGETYTLTDLTDDVLAVLDAAGAPAAHVVGFSLGGLVLTDLADRAPERVLSIALISASSPDPNAGIGPDFFDMVGDDPVATMVGAMGSPTDDDRAWVEAEVAEAARRAPGRPEAGPRHQAAVYRSTWPTLAPLRAVRVPALVLHGRDDRKLPVAHGQAFAREVPGSELVVMDGMGHLPRPAQWDAIGARMIEHLRRATA